MRKIQLPAIGGIRKTIKLPDVVSGTTIAEFGSQSITLAQLRAALATPTPPNTQTPANAATGYLTVGPGLTGGGLLPGTLTVLLTAPQAAPLLVDEDEGDDDDAMIIPGPVGPPGPPGPPAPATFFLAEDPEDYEDENVVFVPLSL